MNKEWPTILHMKYSLDDGHVAPQIKEVPGYNGIIVKNKKNKRSAFKDVVSIKKIKNNPKKFMQSKNVVAFHVHHATLTKKMMFLKKKYGLPMIVSFRGKDTTSYPRKKENRKKLQEIFETGDLFLPVCHHLKNRLIDLGCPEDKIRVLYGGVNVDRFKFKPRKFPENGKIHFIGVGRFVPKKGFDILIEAFAALKKKYPRIKLTLIGEGELETRYYQLILKNELTGVKIKPWVDYQKIQKKLHLAHIFCAPSYTEKNGNQEGIPNTLKEAMATGMPVISTYHAGIPELVEHGKSGLLVHERSVEELANAMEWLIQHPETWAQFGENARKKIEIDFNQRRQLEKQKEYYDQLLGTHP